MTRRATASEWRRRRLAWVPASTAEMKASQPASAIGKPTRLRAEAQVTDSKPSGWTAKMTVAAMTPGVAILSRRASSQTITIPARWAAKLVRW